MMTRDRPPPGGVSGGSTMHHKEEGRAERPGKRLWRAALAVTLGGVWALAWPASGAGAADLSGLGADVEPLAGGSDAAFFRVDEVRVGGSYHSIEGWPNEHGADVTAEVLFGRQAPVWPSSLAEFFLKPRVHLGTSINTSGDTNQIYAGLTWNLYLTDALFLEGTFGGAIHDGPLDKPHVASYGCRANFRESAGVGVRLGEHWRLVAEIDHMSQAQLCAERNSGLTNVGLKLGYAFGDPGTPLK